MPIVGTAGHVDHGKSTLVQALTGRDPDRWAEEKERGLTIDLGFAWVELAAGTTVGFVDVPGHERFMKNMLAGVGALDVALFVVAADEGWMPQSEEHLAVLDLLEVTHGVIALSRADLVDADTLEIAELEIDDRVAGTTLAGWPVVAVSPVTGRGLDDLRTALLAQLEAAGEPPDRGRPRLWIDRSFLISGAGVVVTGTLTGGTLHKGDTLSLFPGEETVRVRGLQSHEHEVETAAPGTRTAVNLSGVDRDLIERGALLARPGQARASRQLLAEVRTVREYEDGLTDRGAFHLHLGSGAWPVHVRPVGTEVIATSGAALLALDEAVPAAVGDRFILREVGRRAVVAGGRVLDPAPVGRISRIAAQVNALANAANGSPDERAQALLEARGTASLAELDIDSGGGRPAEGIFTAETVTTNAEATRMLTAIERSVRDYQTANPLRAGAPRASLSTGLGISGDLLDVLIADADGLIDDGATVRTEDFSSTLGPREDAAWAGARAVLLGEGPAVPRATQLGLDQELLHALIRSGELVQIAPDLVYLPEQIDDILEQLETLADGFTVADFRDALGVARRQAVPLLEWLDATGKTSRRGDVRTVRKPSGPGASDAPPR
jgi:selenocysteine-specific elongation factor